MKITIRFPMSFSTQSLLKAELHSHVEGTVTPDMARKLFSRHNMPTPDGLFNPDGSYVWVDFLTFVTKTYDAVAAAVKTQQDYYDITFDYLSRLAAQNTIYSELIITPALIQHLNGLPAKDILDGMTQAIDDARDKFDIETRMIATFVRHLDLEASEKEIQYFEKNPHKYVTGFGIAGAEVEDDIFKFAPLFERAHNIGLGISAHASEACGAASVKNLLEAVPYARRIGHGVRIIEDMDVVKQVADKEILLEICPTSNLRLGIYPDYASHPLKKLMDLGVKTCLNSDDATFFGTSLGNEYEVTHKEIGLSKDALNQATKNALQGAFVESVVKEKLLAKIG